MDQSKKNKIRHGQETYLKVNLTNKFTLNQSDAMFHLPIERGGGVIVVLLKFFWPLVRHVKVLRSGTEPMHQQQPELLQ